jgi:hypothetical protein
VGFSSAAKYYGDGSGLTNVSAAGDNLGNHIATTMLNMANNQIINVSSLTITGRDAATGYSLWLSSGINMAGGTVNAGNGYIIGNGSQLTNLNASNLTSGTVEDGRLSGNVDFLNAHQTLSGIKTFTSSVTVTDARGIYANRQVLSAGVEISSEASAALGGGVRISSNVYIVGFSSAAKYYGDGSGLTGITGATDNTKVLKAGDTMTGQLTLSGSSLTVTSASGVGTANVLFNPNVALSSTTAASYGGVYASSHVFVNGNLYAAKFYGDGSGLIGGDNLGNHIATTTLNMGGNSIVNAASGTFTQGITASSFTATGTGLGAVQLRLGNNVLISSEASAALGGGVTISTNVYIIGFSSAAKYYGDG